MSLDTTIVPIIGVQVMSDSVEPESSLGTIISRSKGSSKTVFL